MSGGELHQVHQVDDLVAGDPREWAEWAALSKAVQFGRISWPVCAVVVRETADHESATS